MAWSPAVETLRFREYADHDAAQWSPGTNVFLNLPHAKSENIDDNDVINIRFVTGFFIPTGRMDLLCFRFALKSPS